MQGSCCDTLTGQYGESCAADLVALQTFLSEIQFKEQTLFLKYIPYALC